MATSSPLGASAHVLTTLAGGRRVRVLGAEGGFAGLLVARLVHHDRRAPVAVVATTEAAATAIASDAAFFLGHASPADSLDVNAPVMILPDPDVSPYGDVAPDPRLVGARLAALDRLAGPPTQQPRVVVCSLPALMRKVIAPAPFRGLARRLKVGRDVGRDATTEHLLALGFQRVEIVEDPGTFAVRGGITDIFTPRLEFPVRIEWLGDEIERMRLFDPRSQRGLRNIDECPLHPVRETIVTTHGSVRARILARGDVAHAPSSHTRQVVENLDNRVDFFGIEGVVAELHDDLAPVWEHFPTDTVWVALDPSHAIAVAHSFHNERTDEYENRLRRHAIVSTPDSLFVSAADVSHWMRGTDVHLEAAHESPLSTDDRFVVHLEISRNPKLRAELETARRNRQGEILAPLVRALSEYVEHGGWRVLLVAPNLSHAERLTGLLRAHGFDLQPPKVAEGEPLDLETPSGRTRIEVVPGGLTAGFESVADRLFLLAEEEVFGKIRRRGRKTPSQVGVGDVSQLTPGDHVVHVVHGIGRYEGLTHLDVGKVPGDFVVLEYAGGDRLYLPIYRLGDIERYTAADGKTPRLDRMGGVSFAAKTRKVKDQVRQMAEELLQIYAQREALEGYGYPDPDDLYREFESLFPFEETDDQQDAIDAVQRDLGRSRPMDRLVCGDVGFGKTEVALRAAFRVIESGKQVAVLAPTTILVQQHFTTFRDRMARFGITVGMLNRFVSAPERQKTVDGIRTGAIDLVVGTHRLLSRDIRFRDLGLLVIDEEHKFGVGQKERFKRLRTQVDVLTLSATPIPRTLHMSMIGIREISLIMTPPLDRLAIRTHLTRPSDAVLEGGIRRELARGGQVFYVVPKVLGIEEHARRIRELVPEARVAVAHGQMAADGLERTMVAFVEHQVDVLVSTTIIESGLDIPRANTMFIAQADHFGLAQLYQLRGRIGRARRRAHCFLLVNSLERLSPEAHRRLEALQRHSQLGSGFHVASHDLEIRGAGEVLGARQSGNIAAVGFDTYARILAEAVAELRGEPIVRESDPEMVFDVPGFLPDVYVEDVGQRLDLYRRLSGARDVEQVLELRQEIRDRFGELPPEADHLTTIMACKTYGRRLGATAVELAKNRLTVRVTPDHPLGSAAGWRPESDRWIARLSEASSSDGERLAQARSALSVLANACPQAGAGPSTVAKGALERSDG